MKIEKTIKQKRTIRLFKQKKIPSKILEKLIDTARYGPSARNTQPLEYIIIDDNMKTSTEGVFACGDCTNQKLKQVVVASGQGAIAAKNAYDWIRNNG